MSRRTDYTQLFIGDCGHTCGWPQISGEVICETCTRERYSLPEDANLVVWVRASEVLSKKRAGEEVTGKKSRKTMKKNPPAPPQDPLW